MSDLTNQQLTLAISVVAAVALLAFIVAVFLAFRLRKIRNEYSILRGEGTEQDIFATVGRTMKKLDALSGTVDGLAQTQLQQAEHARFAIQKFGLVRYDAFDDMGGRLSFSAALLDDHGDGVVITSINGRTETRTYAKPVKALSSEHNLSGEERQAIASAAGRTGKTGKTGKPGKTKAPASASR